MSEEPAPYYSNLDSPVGTKEPENKKAWETMGSYTVVWDGEQFVFVGTRWSTATTKRNSNDIRLFVNGKDKYRVVLQKIE